MNSGLHLMLLRTHEIREHFIQKDKDIALNSGIHEDDNPEFSKNSQMIEKFISIGLNSSEPLLSLVEDVLNLSKINVKYLQSRKVHLT
jgi:signal transduction histidine kinase